MYVTQAERDALVGTRVTLDSKPAIILGRYADFATVAQTPEGSHYRWEWEIARRIVEAENGEFKS